MDNTEIRASLAEAMVRRWVIDATEWSSGSGVEHGSFFKSVLENELNIRRHLSKEELSSQLAAWQLQSARKRGPQS
jgi:hypothetical protein